MTIYQITSDRIQQLQTTTFAEAGLKERGDLQRLLRAQVEIISPDTLIIAEEFGEWEDSRRRIDLLGVDREANLVVIELKRTEDGGHMELQALRYAAMVSNMTFGKAVDIYADYLETRGETADAEQRLLEFLGWSEAEEESFAQDVHVVLASADFSKELTTAVMWLREYGLNITCMRLKPYRHAADQVLLDVQQVIPLPEAEQYQVQLREKKEREREKRVSGRDMTRYDLKAGTEEYKGLPKRVLAWRVIQRLCQTGHTPEWIAAQLGTGVEQVFVQAAGELDAEQMIEAVGEQRRRDGRPFEPHRFFMQDDQLIRSKGVTYAVIGNIWGRGSEVKLKQLCAVAPEAGLSISIASRE